MADAAVEKEEKEKRRKKQAKRMGKVLARAWQLDDSEDFPLAKRSMPPRNIDLVAMVGRTLLGISEGSTTDTFTGTLRTLIDVDVVALRRTSTQNVLLPIYFKNYSMHIDHTRIKHECGRS
jgi:hypothetical protein